MLELLAITVSEQALREIFTSFVVSVESIQSNRFYGARCATENDAGRGRCSGTPGAWMGGEPSNFDQATRGIFHFETNRREPFAVGPVRPF